MHSERSTWLQRFASRLTGGHQSDAGAPPAWQPLDALDFLLLLVLGAQLTLAVSGDPAFGPAGLLTRFTGSVPRVLITVGATLVLCLMATAAVLAPRHWRRIKPIALALLFAILVVGPTVHRVIRGAGAAIPTQFAHDGGVIHAQESARFLLAGVNPYAADFSGTALRGTGVPGIKIHYPYLPLSFLLAVPTVVAIDAGWPIDHRVSHLVLLLACVLLAPRAFASAGVGELARTLFVLNPLLVPYVIEGRNEIHVIAFLFFAYLGLMARRPLACFGWLAAACAFKQFAWIVAPFLIVYAWRHWPRRELARGLAWGAGWFALLVLPFVLWSPRDFVADVFLFNAGLTAQPYPLGGTPGFGFAMLAAALGWTEDRMQYLPLLPWVLATAGVLCVLLLFKLSRVPRRESVFLYSLVVTAWVFFFSRVFHTNYFGFLTFLAIMGVLLAVDRALSGSPGWERPADFDFPA
jgi:hypothetical protein